MTSITANPSLAIDARVNATLSELEWYAFRLGLALREWDIVTTWGTLRFMAPIVSLESSECPFKKPHMGKISLLFGFLKDAILASDVPKARSILEDMLLAAHLS